jgi:hypothetical protein
MTKYACNDLISLEIGPKLSVSLWVKHNKRQKKIHAAAIVTLHYQNKLQVSRGTSRGNLPSLVAGRQARATRKDVNSTILCRLQSVLFNISRLV